MGFTTGCESCKSDAVHASRVLLWSVGLAMAGCDTGNAPDNAEVLARLKATDERLAAMDAKLDAAATKLDGVSTWVAAQVEQDKRLAAERLAREAKRDASRAEREARRLARDEARAKGELLDPFGSTDGTMSLPSDGGGTPEDASANIACKPAGADAAKCTINRGFLESLLANPESLAKQARIVPSQRDAKTVGYKLYGIRPGSLPRLLSMKNGDMLVSINDTALTSLDNALAAYAELRDETHLDIELERKGRPFDLQVDIIE